MLPFSIVLPHCRQHNRTRYQPRRQRKDSPITGVSDAAASSGDVLLRRDPAARPPALRRVDRAGPRRRRPAAGPAASCCWARRRRSFCARWTGAASATRPTAWRQALAEAAHTTPERVAVHCVHPHNAPFADVEAQKLIEAAPGAADSLDLKFFDRVVEAVADAP